MSSGHHRIKWRRNTAENFNRLSRVHERYKRQTDARRHIANVNMSSRSLKLETESNRDRIVDRKIGSKSIKPNRNITTLSRHLPLPLWRSTTALSITHHSVSEISVPRNSACLLIMKTYHCCLISQTSVYHFLHHHCHHPLLILSSTSGSNLFFSTNPFLYSSSAFPPTRLTPWSLDVFFSFFSGMPVLTLALCARLSWLLVSF